MAGRALKPHPSSTDDLQDWQLILTEKLSKLHAECFEKRRALTRTIQKFPALQGADAMDEIAYAAQVAWNLGLEDAHERAKLILAAGPPEFLGTKDICILSWSFVDESLWRGLSDNKKIIRLARSMVTTGYRPCDAADNMDTAPYRFMPAQSFPSMRRMSWLRRSISSYMSGRSHVSRRFT